MDTSKVWDKEAVQSLIDTNDKAVVRALLALYALQTADEKFSHTSVEHNKAGFSGVDAPILTSFAQFYHSRGFLTGRQIGILRTMLPKYWRQLLVICQSKGHNVKLTVPRKPKPPQQGVLL